MSDNFLKVLHNQGGLTITFVVDEGEARVEFETNSAIDLSAVHDVVVVLNARGFDSEVVHRQKSVVALGRWEDVNRPAHLMVRVHEFFDGWELD